MDRTVCAFTSVCGEDEEWVDQYLAEVLRVDVPFVVMLHRCKLALQYKLSSHRKCVGWYVYDGDFDETRKQPILDMVASLSFHWAMPWDVDETWEADAPSKMRKLLADAIGDCVDIGWVNLWGDDYHVRVDGPFGSGHRVKFLNLRSGAWKFTHPVVNGAKLQGRRGVQVRGDLTCVHHGMKTHELRVMHKARWDRIYSEALRGDPNPYGFWNYALDPDVTPKVVEWPSRQS